MTAFLPLLALRRASLAGAAVAMFGCGGSSAQPDAAKPTDANFVDTAVDAAPQVAVSGFVASQAGLIAGATVALDDGATTTTTASDGTYTIMVAENGQHFVRASMPGFQGDEVGIITTTSAVNHVDLILTSYNDIATVAAALDPPDTFQRTLGFVQVLFTGNVLTDMSVTISAGHSMSYTFVGGHAKYGASITDAPLIIFPNVTPGTTLITPNTGISGIVCTPSPAITSWRVDANTATSVVLTCT
jgi:hypothetical protein